MKLMPYLPLILLASCATVPATSATPAASIQATDWHDNRVAFYIGQRSLDDDYSPVEDQAAVGFEFTHEGSDSAIGFEAGVMGSGDDHSSDEGSTGELYAGMRKTFGRDTVRPYIGAGVSLIGVDLDAGAIDDDDSSATAYAHVGVTIDVTSVVFVGIDARALFGSDVTLDGVDTDADYGQIAFVIGFGL